MQNYEACVWRYDHECKDNAVALVRGGRAVSELARDLGVSTWALSRWVAAANGGQVQSEPKTLAAESDEQRELRRLRQENDYLREQRDILEKSVGHLVSGDAGARYTRMQKMSGQHSLPALAQALEVSSSGFHAHRQKDQCPRRCEDRTLMRAIAPIFVASRRTDGCPRVTAALRARGGRAASARRPRHNPL